MANPNGNPNLPPGGGPNRRQPLRGRHALAVIKDLAAGDLTFQEMAEKHGRHRTTIWEFAHKPDTERAVRNLREAKGDALAALWASDKANRVAEYQDSAERLSQVRTVAGKADPAAERARQAALRAVAEELGQLTTKIEGRFTRYEVSGVDPQDMT